MHECIRRRTLRERSLMTPDFRVGRGVQNDPKKSDVIGYIIVGHGR